MAEKRLPVILFVLLVIAAAANAQISSLCGVDVEDLISKCVDYVIPAGPIVDPSTDCCAVVSTLNIPCLCDNIPSGIEQTMSFDKAVYVANKCGNPMKKGSKCGSKYLSIS